MVAAESTMAARTSTVVFHQERMASSQTLSGHCWTASIASRRSDAYRCMTGNEIYDPCFKVNSRTVACPTNPTVNRGVRIRLTKPLPQANVTNSHNAWMMQLAGGAQCNLGTGTTILDYPFYCTQGLVCTAPSPALFQPAIFVVCGRPKNGTTVRDVGHYLVTTMYE